MLKPMYLIGIFLGVLVIFSVCNNTNSSISSNKNNTTKTNSSISSSKNSTTKDTPEITIKAGNNDIISSVKSKDVYATDKEDTELFKSIMNDHNVTIPYVKLGGTIQIELKNKVTDTYQLNDYILREDGTPKYKKPTIKTTDITFNEGVGSFILNENLWVNLSSNLMDYEPGKTIRGFRLLCNSVDKQQEYIFIIKTDAKKE